MRASKICGSQASFRGSFAVRRGAAEQVLGSYCNQLSRAGKFMHGTKFDIFCFDPEEARIESNLIGRLSDGNNIIARTKLGAESSFQELSNLLPN